MTLDHSGHPTYPRKITSKNSHEYKETTEMPPDKRTQGNRHPYNKDNMSRAASEEKTSWARGRPPRTLADALNGACATCGEGGLPHMRPPVKDPEREKSSGVMNTPVKTPGATRRRSAAHLTCAQKRP